MIKLRNKNQLTFQSCRYCSIGASLYRVDSEEGSYYVCEEHRREKDFIKELPVEGVEEEFGVKTGIFARAMKYLKGG